MKPIIEIADVGKCYQIGARKEPYLSLRDEITRVASRVRPGSKDRGLCETAFWALREVSFCVQEGEAVGIIGRNGAGKSTLLKILSQITPPTEGRIVMRGRVASLLEVGTGFHPELTGRENIFLNGAILGMGRREIKRKFDEIVAFAETEKFLDTPVKRYSSGMYVRLAFAVAAHLEPEILVVDEVLAVGDAQFQKKCLGKMGEVAGSGRTVLFVSHNMAAIQALCKKAFLLEQGRLLQSGSVADVLSTYMQRISPSAARPLSERTDRKGDGKVRLTSLAIDGGGEGSLVRCSDILRIRIGYTAVDQLSNPAFIVGIYDQFNQPLFFLDTRTAGWLPDTLPASGLVECNTSPINITPGRCTVNVAVMLGGVIADHVKHAHSLEIVADDFYGTGRLPDRQQALCLLRQNWQVKESDNRYDSSSGGSSQ